MKGAAFVTGGSGFVGGRLIERLVDDGVEVRALARSAAAAARVAALGAEPVHGDLQDRVALRAGAFESDVVIHCAAHVGGWGRAADIQRTNVAGTANVLRAAKAAGAPRFVHVSSLAAVIDGRPLIAFDENVPLRPRSRSPYCASKAQSDQLVLEAADTSFAAAVIRPGLLWGPGDTSLLPDLLAAVHAGQFAWLDEGRQQTVVTHVDNLVEAVVLAAEHGRAGEAYFVADDERVTLREFVSALLDTQGITPPERNYPAAIARAAAAASEEVWQRLPISRPPPVTRLQVWIGTLECSLQSTRARDVLGYRPVRSHDEALRELQELAGLETP